ncbi:hypothetical protein B0I35DRAFT_418184 [Stachybotrys elegans]|uniref:Uncharacterized protein n=1 Tax=Stachybotrys elegans TaxID=80388 RepID=A0A8K0T2K9_9HYPO|nr:hypothetical protein B0I35DRAFT_418184 [Stachybotrys elegans]
MDLTCSFRITNWPCAKSVGSRCKDLAIITCNGSALLHNGSDPWACSGTNRLMGVRVQAT